MSVMWRKRPWSLRRGPGLHRHMSTTRTHHPWSFQVRSLHEKIHTKSFRCWLGQRQRDLRGGRKRVMNEARREQPDEMVVVHRAAREKRSRQRGEEQYKRSDEH